MNRLLDLSKKYKKRVINIGRKKINLKKHLNLINLFNSN